MDIAREIQSSGFAIVPEVLDSATIGQLKSARMTHGLPVKYEAAIHNGCGFSQGSFCIACPRIDRRPNDSALKARNVQRAMIVSFPVSNK